MDLSYDGSEFLGWQKQPHGQTVQGELERVIKKIFEEDIKLIGASRTDSGVHAFHQVAHFDCKKDPTKIKLKHALQGNLPRTISILQTYLAPPDFHANRSPTRKTYRYLIRNAFSPSALRHDQSVWVRKPLNLDYLNLISEKLLGNQDFKSFQNAGTEVESTIREILEARWSSPHPGWAEFWITGNGFLKQMVRNIVGTLLSLENDKAPVEKLVQIIEKRSRQAASKTAPPEGLFLYKVFFPIELDKRCRKI